MRQPGHGEAERNPRLPRVPADTNDYSDTDPHGDLDDDTDTDFDSDPERRLRRHRHRFLDADIVADRDYDAVDHADAIGHAHPSITPTPSSTPACGASRYDVDLNGSVGPLSDGVLALRYLFQFTGAVLVQGALGQGAMRTSPAAIIEHLDCLRTTLLDVDGNLQAAPLTDGILLLRYFFGFRGAALTVGAVAMPGCTRCDAMSIETFIAAGLS